MAITSVTHTSKGPTNNRRITYHITRDDAPPIEFLLITRDAGFNSQAYETRVQTHLEERSRRREIEAWLADTEQLAVPNYAARPRYLSTWRARYKKAMKEEHRRLGYKMHREVQAGTFTNPQMNNAWGMTNPQRNQFLARVETAHDGWVTLQAEVGE